MASSDSAPAEIAEVFAQYLEHLFAGKRCEARELIERTLDRGVSGRKLIEYVVDGSHTQTQLFDLQADPWELTNLADNPGHAKHLARLRKELARWRDEWDDTSTQWGKQFWEGYGEA